MVFCVGQVGLINASPLSMGLLTQEGPPPWHPATDYQKQVCREVGGGGGGGGEVIGVIVLKALIRIEERLITGSSSKL